MLLVVFGKISCKQPKNNNNEQATNEPVKNEIIKLSTDKKTILQGTSVLLKIDDAEIFGWFETKSGLCRKGNNNESRNLFCDDIVAFLSKTSFVNMHLTKNNKYIVFEISTTEMEPDKVVGHYTIATKKITWLTNYYLMNEFISYSPDESKFIYQNNCWEGMCGLTVKANENLQTLKEINNPESADTRNNKAIFNKWIDNNTINYTLKDHVGNSKDFTISL